MRYRAAWIQNRVWRWMPICCRSSVVLFLLHSNDCPMSVRHCLYRMAQDESRSVVQLVGVNLGENLCASDWFSVIWRAVPHYHFTICSLLFLGGVLFLLVGFLWWCFFFFFKHAYPYLSQILLGYLWFSSAAAYESLCQSLWVPWGFVRWKYSIECSAAVLPESFAKQGHVKLGSYRQAWATQASWKGKAWFMLYVKTSWCSMQAEELPYHWWVSSSTGKTAATLLSKTIRV